MRIAFRPLYADTRREFAFDDSVLP